MKHRADTPEISVCANASWHGLVHIGVGTGMPAYNITPERAEDIAADLVAAAAAARAAGR
jgi:hypothetical protein